MKAIFVLLLILISSCSFLKRDISSVDDIDDIDLSTTELLESCSYSKLETGSCWRISGKANLLYERQKTRSFKFPILSLKTPFHGSLPFYIRVKTKTAKCSISGNIVEQEKLSYKILKSDSETSLSCHLKNSKEFEFEYFLPYLESFPVSEAEWMDGFFPNIVSQTELKLSQILKKWNYAKLQLDANFKFSDGITYRGRELLLKYLNDSNYYVIRPKKFTYGFEQELEPGDMILVKNPRGKVYHPKLGETDHRGFLTDNYLESQSAGKRYLEIKDIKPFEFFCRFKNKLYTFRTTDEVLFDKEGSLKCGLNIKKRHILEFKKTKGYIEFDTEFMAIEKSIGRIPSNIANSQTRITNKIFKMNLENRNLFEKWINRAIEEKVTEREEELELDMEFPFSIQLEGKSFERNFLKICGELHPDILGSNQARIKVDEVRAVYGNEHEISKEIRVIPLLQTQFKFVPDKRICVPLSTRMYLKKKYLNTVLFYEP